jgi:hypothetical protein
LDKHALYELTVQSPSTLVPFLRKIHGAKARVLGEDFAGTAALSRAWIATVDSGTAIAIDHDADVLARAAGVPGLTRVQCDLRGEIPHAGPPLDIVFVGNFSIGELQTRGELIPYLRRARERLARGGVFVCDTYGGESAFRVGAIERTHTAPDGALIRYTWEQREADALTARVVNALHFRVLRGGEVVQEFTDAFVYRWRLWSVPEIRDALIEVGFGATEVHANLDAATDTSPAHALRGVGDSFIVCVSGRV